MRVENLNYKPLFCQFGNHDFSKKLQNASDLIDRHPEIIKKVHADLCSTSNSRGAKGMTSESVFRAAILKQIEQASYRHLEYLLRDSKDAIAFTRIQYGLHYSDSTLQANISLISAATWEYINQVFITDEACLIQEKGRKVRIDSTVVETNIHFPTDSSLILDCIRVLERMRKTALEQAIQLPYLKLALKRAKKLHLRIINAKNDETRLNAYTELLVDAEDTLKSIPESLTKLPEDSRLFQEMSKTQVLFECIIGQAVARVLKGQHVPALEKVVSIFEDHTDVIVKSRRETEFGHKVFFTTGKSNLVLDCVIEEGNPSDTQLLKTMIERQLKIFGRSPRQVAVDGGFSSHKGLVEIKELGVQDVCMTKSKGITKDDMARSEGVFERLRNFRAGIESNISCLKRRFGLDRSLWKGSARFRSYVWANVVAYNILLLSAT